MKRIVSLCLAFLVMLTLMPVVHTESVQDSFAVWQNASVLPDQAGKYCLNAHVTLNAGWNVPAGETTLCLHGHTVSGRITIPAGAVLTIEDCTGRGKLINEVEQSAQVLGGAIYNLGTLNLRGGTITAKGAAKGGAIYSEGTVNMYGGTIAGSTAKFGGGIYNEGGTLNMYDGTIINTSASKGGGGLYFIANATAHLYGGTVSGAKAPTGGVYISKSTVTIDGLVIENCVTEQGGAGIFCSGESAVLTIRSGEIRNCNVTGKYSGGGLLLTNAATLNLYVYDNYFSGNSANGGNNIHIDKECNINTFGLALEANEDVFFGKGYKHEMDHAVYYAVQIEEMQNGAVTTADGKNYYAAGETVSLSVSPKENCELESLTVTCGEKAVAVTDNAFVMPAGNVQVSAVFSSHQMSETGSLSVYVNEESEIASGEKIGLQIRLTGAYSAFNGAMGGQQFTDGTAEVFCAKGGGVVLADLPAGMGYVVTPLSVESSAAEDYTFALTNQSGAIPGYANGQPQSVICSVMAQRKQYNIIVTDTTQNGTVSAMVENKTVTKSRWGDPVTLTFTPEEGYELVDVTIIGLGEDELYIPAGDLSTAEEKQYSFLMPKGEVTIAANYARHYAVTVSDIENGAVKADKSRAAAGETVTLTIEPEENYSIRALFYALPDGSKVSIDHTVSPVVFTMPASDVTLSGEFKRTSLQESVRLILQDESGAPLAGGYKAALNGAAVGSDPAERTLPVGRNVISSFENIPEGYEMPADAVFQMDEYGAFTSVSAHAAVKREEGIVVVTITLVKKAPPLYTVTVTASPAVGGTVTGGGSYEAGSTVTVCAAAKEGYLFGGWMENGVSVSTESTYCFAAEAQRTLTAVFAEKPHEHTFAEKFSYDEETHWHAAVCGHSDAVSGLEKHHGGKATCASRAVCEDCGQPYGALAEHAYGALIGAQAEVHTQESLCAAVAAHYVCGVCRTYFTEEKQETTLQALTGEMPVHDDEDWICTDPERHWKECLCGLQTQSGPHDYDGEQDIDCNTCGHKRKVHTCVGVFSTGQAASCTEDGWKGFYQCSCEKRYADKNCAAEITDLEAWKKAEGRIPSEGHAYGELIPAEEEMHTPTMLSAAVAAHYRCGVCKEYFTADKVQTTMEALTGEKPAHDAAVWVNTDAQGHWKRCSVCGLEDQDSVGCHVFEDERDASCGLCGYVRPIMDDGQQDGAGSAQEPQPSGPVNHPEREEIVQEVQSAAPGAHYVVLCRRLNIRAGAGTFYYRLGTLARGAVVHGEDAGNGWIRIEHNGAPAYISAQYAEEVRDAQCEDRVIVLCRKLNVRVGAGLHCDKVGSVRRGESLCVTAENNGWYEVIYNGRKAYVSAAYCAAGEEFRAEREISRCCASADAL